MRSPQGSECLAIGCTKKPDTKGLCPAHHRRLRVHGDPEYGGLLDFRDGRSREQTYPVWKNIIQRTENPNCKSYKNYGERNIRLCKEWRSDFWNFKRDVGNPPTPGYELDRKEVNGHYSCGDCEDCIANGWPMNVRWVTSSLQSYNQRLQSNNTSGFRGVSSDKVNSKWFAKIRYNCVEIKLGRFTDTEQGALAYDCAAIQLYGYDAKLNILTQEPAK